MLSTNGTETVECPQLREALGYGCHFPMAATQSHSHKLGDFKEQPQEAILPLRALEKSSSLSLSCVC